VLLQNDGLDASLVEKLGQEQPRRAAADDADLRLHDRRHAEHGLGDECVACFSITMEGNAGPDVSRRLPRTLIKQRSVRQRGNADIDYQYR
jgi:hypothetical protein